MRIKRDEVIDTDTSGLRSSAEDMGAVIHAAKDIVQKEDIAELFKPVKIDPLILTASKVKRTRDDYQESITVLNRNMVTIDANLRQILNLLKDYS